MPRNDWFYRDRLTCLCGEKRCGICILPTILIGTCDIKSPKMSFEITGINPVSGAVSIEINYGGREKSVSVGDGAHAGWDA